MTRLCSQPIFPLHADESKQQLVFTLAILFAAYTVSAALWLQDSASVQQAAVPIMHELLKNANVFLVTHVMDDVGEATVRGALEDVGLVGTSEGQIKPHRLVFCSTLEGKVSIVRQLEPDLHIDGHPSTVCSHRVTSISECNTHSCPCILDFVYPWTSDCIKMQQHPRMVSCLSHVLPGLQTAL